MRLLKKNWLWWAAILLVLVFASAWIFLQKSRPAGAYAKIVHGDVTTFVSLDTDRVFSLESDPSIRFEVLDGAIRFIDADCPDKICEHAGFLSKVGETAACLPRDTLLVITGGAEGEVDIIAG